MGQESSPAGRHPIQPIQQERATREGSHRPRLLLRHRTVGSAGGGGPPRRRAAQRKQPADPHRGPARGRGGHDHWRDAGVAGRRRAGGSISAAALETIAFAIIASDHFRWEEDEAEVGRVLLDWASPEINWELTPGNLRMFRQWLTGEVRPPSEPDVTPDTLSGSNFPRRKSKVRVLPGDG